MLAHFWSQILLPHSWGNTWDKIKTISLSHTHTLSLSHSSRSHSYSLLHYCSHLSRWLSLQQQGVHSHTHCALPLLPNGEEPINKVSMRRREIWQRWDLFHTLEQDGICFPFDRREGWYSLSCSLSLSFSLNLDFQHTSSSHSSISKEWESVRSCWSDSLSPFSAALWRTVLPIHSKRKKNEKRRSRILSEISRNHRKRRMILHRTFLTDSTFVSECRLLSEFSLCVENAVETRCCVGFRVVCFGLWRR